MALKIWTFLLVMSLPAAEHGRGFGSLAAVLSGIDYHWIQQKLYYADDRNDGGHGQRSESTLFVVVEHNGSEVSVGGQN